MDPLIEFKIARVENELGAKWIKKGTETKYMIVRNGDSLIAPFQCDYFWHVSLKGYWPDKNSQKNIRLMIYVRRVNLDMFWG